MTNLLVKNLDGFKEDIVITSSLLTAEALKRFLISCDCTFDDVVVICDSDPTLYLCDSLCTTHQEEAHVLRELMHLN